MGLVNRLTPPARHLAALELAATIAANGPWRCARRSGSCAKRLSTAAQMFDRQREISEPVRAPLEDAREGATAFKEKRAPRWRGV